MRCALLMLVMGLVGVVRSRYAPTRDHSKDLVSLINEQQHIRDARIIYNILKQDPDFFMDKRETQGFDSSEKDFDGFQHPFFYVSHQKQQQEVEQPRGPFVFSRLGGEAPVDPSKAVLVEFPFRHRRLIDEPQGDLATSDDIVAADQADVVLDTEAI